VTHDSISPSTTLRLPESVRGPAVSRTAVATSVAIAVGASVLALMGASPVHAADVHGGETHDASWAWADLSDGRVTIGADRPDALHGTFPWTAQDHGDHESHDVTDVVAWVGGVEVPVGGTNWVAYGNDFEVSLTADDFWVGDRASTAAQDFLEDGVITATVDGVAGNTIVVRGASVV
jgi:hypothetical protein